MCRIYFLINNCVNFFIISVVIGMTGEEKIWIRVDGKHVESHALDANTLSILLHHFQELLYMLKERQDSPASYKIYVKDIMPGSSIVGLSNYTGNLHRAYGIVNNMVLGINTANSCEDIEVKINNINKSNKAVKILTHFIKLWPEHGTEIGIAVNEEPPKDSTEYTYFNPSKRKYIEELIEKYHEPVKIYKHGILISLDSDLKRFGLKTSSGKIKGKYDSLSEKLKNEISEFFDKPVKIHGDYDEIKKEFVKIYSISISNEVIMQIFGKSKPDNRLKKAIENLIYSLDNIVEDKNTIENYLPNGSKIDSLKNTIDDLEKAIKFKYFSEEREDILWDYTDTLRLFLLKYDTTKSAHALIEMMDLFNEYIYDILLPIPEQIEKNQNEEYSLKTYEAVLSAYENNVRERLNEIKTKYDYLLPSYEELKESVEKIKFDEDLKLELGKIIKGEEL